MTRCWSSCGVSTEQLSSGGSTAVALAVRGVAIEPGDIDVHVSDSSLAGLLFDDLLVTPVTPIGVPVRIVLPAAISP